MAEQDLKWHETFVVLFGAMLSFADPITDILTLVEFYRADHKTWFGVGLAFVILPCLVFPVIFYFSKETELKEASRARRYVQVFLCGFNPFSAALARIQTFIFYLKNFKNLWHGHSIKPISPGTASDEEAYRLLTHGKLVVLFEAALESAPQFIIQLYAMSVQLEPVKVIQMISLPVSFLSLAWASTVADEVIHSKGLQATIDVLNVKNKILLFITHLFLLSSRMFAIGFFAVTYKWWIIAVLLIHSAAIVIVDTIWVCRRGICDIGTGAFSTFFVCLHWLRDDMSIRVQDVETDNKIKELRRMQLFSNALYIAENCTMILLYYFSALPRAWYSLLLTVCVCSFSVLGAIIRVTHFHFLTKSSNSTWLPPGFDFVSILLQMAKLFD